MREEVQEDEFEDVESVDGQEMRAGAGRDEVKLIDEGSSVE